MNTLLPPFSTEFSEEDKKLFIQLSEIMKTIKFWCLHDRLDELENELIKVDFPLDHFLDLFLPTAYVEKINNKKGRYKYVYIYFIFNLIDQWIKDSPFELAKEIDQELKAYLFYLM